MLLLGRGQLARGTLTYWLLVWLGVLTNVGDGRGIEHGLGEGLRGFTRIEGIE